MEALLRILVLLAALMAFIETIEAWYPYGYPGYIPGYNYIPGMPYYPGAPPPYYAPFIHPALPSPGPWFFRPMTWNLSPSLTSFFSPGNGNGWSKIKTFQYHF
ncbi:uncharacterized protein LOC111350105 [Spodoptera litura]|uniref:Uncharacterized protein LOC111350105 n=1 Tax=Spodoptera litura TaxID=69820 RepID=A0A9J7DUS7_SPOLT|nr:uncharacterized protein LOC111350105 [Spodoptera litura]